jgi:biopolymer transport protein ExbD
VALRSLGGHGQEDDGLVSSINVIPFVDIVLVLLIIFMLTSSVIMKSSLKVELPRAATAGATVATTLNLTITREGALLVNGAEATMAQAAEVVRAAVASDPRTQAVISGDKGVPYGRVIDVIDLVKLNGLTTFALDVERAPAPE